MFCFESNFNFAPSAFAVSAAYDKYYFKGTPSPAKLHLLIIFFLHLGRYNYFAVCKLRFISLTLDQVIQNIILCVIGFYKIYGP